MRFLFTILLILLCIDNSEAQVISKLDYSKDSINLGEQTAFIYEISIPSNLKIQSIDFSNLDSLQSKIDMQDSLLQDYFAEVEWSENISRFQNKTIPVSDLKMISKGSYQIFKDTFYATFWDFGVFIPENPKINYSEDSLQVEEINVQNKVLLVIPPQNIINPDTTQMILPIEDILEEPGSWKDYLTYVYILLGISLMAIFLIYVIRKSTKKGDAFLEQKEEKPIIPPQVIALSKLESLANEQLWKQGMVKEHQSQLTFIIREYLENLFDIKALESTTDEILRALKEFDFGLSQQNDLKEILQIADLVKFAKATPPEDINEAFIGKAETFVVETHKRYYDLINTNIYEDE